VATALVDAIWTRRRPSARLHSVPAWSGMRTPIVRIPF